MRLNSTQAAGSGNLELGAGKRTVKVEDAQVKKKQCALLPILVSQVTGYAGYKKESFLELPDNQTVSSMQSSSSADEVEVQEI